MEDFSKGTTFRRILRFLWLKIIPVPVWFAGFVFSFCIISCDSQQQESYTPTYTNTPDVKQAVLIFGVHPLHNPQRLFATYKKLYGRHFHFALPNPYQTINAMPHGYHVFAKMGEDENFRGIILVRKDGGISQVADLNGKNCQFPGPNRPRRHHDAALLSPYPWP